MFLRKLPLQDLKSDAPTITSTTYASGIAYAPCTNNSSLYPISNCGCRKRGAHTNWHMCVCVCLFSSHLFWTSSSLDVPAGVTQEEGHTGFLTHLPPAVRAFIFLARRIQPFLSLVGREVEFLCTNDLIVLHLLGILFYFILFYFF